MNKKYIFSIVLSLLQITLGFAQVNITSSLNSMRKGDVLCKIEADNKEPGESGDDCIWVLGQTGKDSKDYIQTILIQGDSVAICEEEDILHFSQRGDTLFRVAEQSRRSYRLYEKERAVLGYPFSYGDSIADDYTGIGRNEMVDYTFSGRGYSVADGRGIIVDGTDTLYNITRIHLHDRITETYSDTLTCDMATDHYMWYCAGYRYPVMETIYNRCIMDEEVVYSDEKSFVYLPIQQMQLPADDENDLVLAALTEKDRQHDGNADASDLEIKASLSAAGDEINISYSIDTESDISFIASDITGNILGTVHYENVSSGESVAAMRLMRRPVGNTIMLNVQCNGVTYAVKVMR